MIEDIVPNSRYVIIAALLVWYGLYLYLAKEYGYIDED